MAGDPLGNPVGNARRDRLAALIDTQRPHLALWVPVFFALGIAFYFALPADGNPGFVIVLGIFLVSFAAALLSHAPGGLGVLEIVFVTGLPDLDPADVLAALIVFRLFYLLVPFAVSLLLILVFERAEFTRRRLYFKRSSRREARGRQPG